MTEALVQYLKLQKQQQQKKKIKELKVSLYFFVCVCVSLKKGSLQAVTISFLLPWLILSVALREFHRTHLGNHPL